MMLTVLLIYLLVGGIFGVAFFTTGYRRIDESATGTAWHVRLFWVPAAIALWPVLIFSWLRPSGQRKEERREQGR